MDYAEALSWIEKQESGGDILKAIKSRVDGILDEKRRATKERETAGDRISTLESLVEHLAKLAGGEGDDPEARIKSATTKVSALAAELESVKKLLADTESAKSAAETEKAEIEQKLNRATREMRVTDAALASGANPNVLRTLVSDSNIGFEIASNDTGRQVLVVNGENKKPIREYAQSNWSDFLPSLFPSASPPPSQKPESRLPSGNPSGEPEKRDLVAQYITSAGFGPKKTA